MHRRILITIALSVSLLWPALVLAAGVQALFGIESPTAGPFPSDLFTSADPDHNTGLRVNLPFPDCNAHPSDCEDLHVINTLDGFNLQPRLSLPFSGSIDVTTATSETVFLVNLGSTLPDGGQVVGINQLVWDPDTNTLHAESDELLDQYTRYALIVTNGVQDAVGDPVETSKAFARLRHDLHFGRTKDSALKAYRKALLDALQAARTAGVRHRDVVVASVFTTQSTTAVLEKIRDQLKAAIPEPTDFNLAEDGSRTVFARSAVSGITFDQQVQTDPAFTRVNVPVARLNDVPGAVGTIAFGKYVSPNYEVPGEFIPPIGTATGVPQVQGAHEVFLNLFLPSGAAPANGWPVAIFGHFLTSTHKDDTPYRVASPLAAHGIATVAINTVGHGFGPLGFLTVNRQDQPPVRLPAGGRGIDQNGDGLIESFEGFEAAPPRRIISGRDGIRQTVVDLMQLVRVIEVGVDVDADGRSDLDPSRIYYFGQSLGGIIGTVLLAVEPHVRAGVLNVPGGSLTEVLRINGILPTSDRQPTHLARAVIAQHPRCHADRRGQPRRTTLLREHAAPGRIPTQRRPRRRHGTTDSVASDERRGRRHGASAALRAPGVGRAVGRCAGVCRTLAQVAASGRASEIGNCAVGKG